MYKIYVFEEENYDYRIAPIMFGDEEYFKVRKTEKVIDENAALKTIEEVQLNREELLKYFKETDITFHCIEEWLGHIDNDGKYGFNKQGIFEFGEEEPEEEIQVYGCDVDEEYIKQLNIYKVTAHKKVDELLNKAKVYYAAAGNVNHCMMVLNYEIDFDDSIKVDIELLEDFALGNLKGVNIDVNGFIFNDEDVKKLQNAAFNNIGKDNKPF